MFAAGFLAGYLFYDMTHYHVHHHQPRTRLGKLMRELHMRHHFQDDTRGFGVSAPFWDYVFGTSAPRPAGRVGSARALPFVAQAAVAELADARRSGRRGGNPVEVRVLSAASPGSARWRELRHQRGVV